MNRHFEPGLQAKSGKRVRNLLSHSAKVVAAANSECSEYRRGFLAALEMTAEGIRSPGTTYEC
jgi:hypothetical protein